VSDFALIVVVMFCDVGPFNRTDLHHVWKHAEFFLVSIKSAKQYDLILFE